MQSCLLALSLMAGVPASASLPRAEATVWYDFGHRLVARIAELRLAPRTVDAIRAILGHPGLADEADWADRIRRQRPSTNPLHFVNIPLEASSYDPNRHCRRNLCIVAAIESDIRTLRDSTASLHQKAEALRFLIHLVGDLHQPLHVSNNRDRGGNLRKVRLFGTPKNLHAVWDGELILATGLDESHYFDRLRLKMDNLDLAALERGTVLDWVMEAHRVSVVHVYRLPRSGQLGDKYLKASLPHIDQALIAAGVRLARVLNETLGGEKGGTRSTGAR